MWIVSGPFDGVVNETGFQKTKLLKTGTSYKLGRKDCPLVIANKKVSSNTGEFSVRKWSADDVGDPTRRPSLEYFNKKEKGVRIKRGEEEIVVNSSATQELEDGDILAIITGVLISIKWVDVCCYVQPVRGKSPVSLEACASLGVAIVHVPNQHVTHHLLSSYTANPIVAASLLSACQFVKPEWLVEVIRLGSLEKSSDPSNGVSLEQLFVLPPITKYRPSYSASLSLSQKEFRVWEPNEERLSMFTGYRFLCVDEKARELDGDFKEVIERGGGSYETFDTTAGKAKFHKALARGQAKEGKKLIVVGKQKSIQATIGKDGWKDLVVEAKSFELNFIEPEIVVKVVVDVDISLFSAQSSDMEGDQANEVPESFSLPDFIPNTHSEEPSIAPPEPEQKTGPPKRLVRRTTSSRQPSQEPVVRVVKTPEPEDPPEIPRPRRALTRRVNAGLPVVTGLDDPSSIIDSVSEISAPSPPRRQAVLDLTAPTPMRSTRLKRRVVGGGTDTLASQTFSLGLDENTEEPPLKKFKALFEASHPDQTGARSINDSIFDIQSATYGSSSQTQTQTQARSIRAGHAGLTANLSTLREEEEETPTSPTMSRGTKRSLVDIDEDTEMDDAQGETLESGTRPSIPKKRALENVNAVEKVGGATKPQSKRASSKPPSSVRPASVSKGGAIPGKPDQDAVFLKAIASTKRGKKTEDEFDRDFNKLKISKPTLGREEPEEEWALLGDFGDETNVRGNFMMVVEMPVYNRGARERRWGGEPVPEWDGKPNFKRFKKKRNTARTSIVELVVSEENDYGIGPAYWRGGNSQSQVQGDLTINQWQTQAKSEAPTQTQNFPTKGKSQAPVPVVNDSDEEIAPRKGRSKIASRASSVVPPKRASTRSAKPPAKAQPLFIESDEDIQGDDVVDIPDDSDDDQTLRSSAGTNPRSRGTQRAARPPVKPKKAAPILVDDDSDDGVFKGFTGKRRAR